MKIPIVVIAYNRDYSLNRLLESLNKAHYDDKVDLFISIDKSDNPKVIQVATEFKWEYGDKNIIKHEEQLGLKNHILNAGDLVYEYDAIIMLEDDLIVSKSFYKYARESVEFYKSDTNIGGISLYTYGISEFADYRTFIPLQDEADVYFMNVPSSWGQIWTKNQWKSFKEWFHSGKYNERSYKGVIPDFALSWGESSWKKYFYMYIAENKKYIVYPRIALSTNMADVGTHHKTKSTAHQSILMGCFNRKYVFKKLDESKSVYDAHFENIKLEEYLELDGKLTVDYYGTKKDYSNTKYLLSTNDMDYKVVKKWSLSLKPYELNVIYNIEGEGLYLYDINKVDKNKRKSIEINRIKYELPGITKEKGLKIALYEYRNAIKRRLLKAVNRFRHKKKD